MSDEIPARGRSRSRPRHPRPSFLRRRALWIAATCVTALLLLAGAGAAALYWKFDGNISEVDIDALLGRDRPEDQPHDSLDILVLGSDSREGDNAAYGQPDGARADTAMVVHINAERDAATVVSLPRDTLVDRPACEGPDGATEPAAEQVMFNESFAVGGPACAVKTVEALSGVRMDHYLEVDFRGFERLVDSLGGVEVTMDAPIRDGDSRLDLAAGTHRLDGEQALALVRTRKSVGDGSDLGRIELQHAFLSSLATEVAEVGALSDPRKLYRLADTATGAVTTDSSLASVSALTALAKDLRTIGPDQLQLVTLPVRYDTDDPNRVVPLSTESRQLWQALREDKPVPDAVAEHPGPSPSPSRGAGEGAE